MRASGQNRKKAIVVISDGNDTNSATNVFELKQAIRESEVLVYAVGIDGDGRFTSHGPVQAAAAEVSRCRSRSRGRGPGAGHGRRLVAVSLVSRSPHGIGQPPMRSGGCRPTTA